MIQSAAPTVASALAPLSGQPAENGAQAAGNGTFADLLASQPEAAAAPVPVDEAAMAAGALAAAQPNLAATLPLTGKILPGLLPDAAAGEAGPVPGPENTGAEEAARTAAGQTIPSLLAAMRAVRLPDQITAQPRHAAQPQAPGTPDAGTATDETDGAAPTGLVPAGFAAPLPSLAVPTPTAGDPATAGLPPMIAAQLLGQPLREAAMVQPQPVANQATAPANPDQALALHLDPARSEAAASAAGTAALSLEAGSAAPAREVRLRPVLASGGEPGPADAAGLFAGAMANAAQPAVAAPATGPLHAARPHDFAALMDRLITARDAAQTGLPQSVHVALDHADFGPISLSFQHDQGGLAVSVASPDPDFARAVQAAIPAATASAGSDSASRDNGQGGAGAQGWTGQSAARSDASATGGDAGQRPSRGTRFEAADAAPAANRSADARDPSASRQRGIFA